MQRFRRIAPRERRGLQAALNTTGARRMARFLTGMTRTTLMGIAIALVIAPAALAQRVDPSTVYLYKGADRDQRLLDAAKKEGTLTFYTSMQTPESGRFGRVREEVWHQGQPLACHQRPGDSARDHRSARQSQHHGRGRDQRARGRGARARARRCRIFQSALQGFPGLGAAGVITSGRARAPISGLSPSTPTR